jgi:hypothetical protein
VLVVQNQARTNVCLSCGDTYVGPKRARAQRLSAFVLRVWGRLCTPCLELERIDERKR